MQEALNIFIVDDDVVDRLAVRRAFQRYHESARVQEAATCAEATEALTSCYFDCVFLIIISQTAAPCVTISLKSRSARA